MKSSRKPKEQWRCVDKKREEMKHRTKWCAGANKYRCMRCGRGSRYMKMPGKCTGPKYLSKKFENGGDFEKKNLEGHDLVQEMLRLREAENGTQITELLQARASGHQGTWQDVKTNPDP